MDSLAGLKPISIEESSVSNLVLSTGSNHYVIHVPAHSYAHPIHVTRTCNKPSCYRESLDISSKGAPKTESEVAPTYRSICLFSGDREEEIWCEV